MRVAAFFLLFSICCVSVTSFAQEEKPERLQDEIAVSRTIISKLDRAVQKDPPSNFASEIVVRVHNAASSYISLADSTNDLERAGIAVRPSTLFMLYESFLDLFDQYQMMSDLTKNKIELNDVLTSELGKEYLKSTIALSNGLQLALAQQEKSVESCRTKSH